MQVVLSVGENLFFRAVTSQVSSAPASLTSVFGMGTGGPSRQSTPTVLFCRLSRRLSYHTTPFRKMQPLFSNFFKKVFERGKWGRKPPASLGPKRGPPSQPSCRNSTPKQACARFARRRGENLPLPSGPGAGRPASPAVETPRPNRRVRVLPAAGEKNSRPIGRLLSVLAKTYFSGPSPAKYLRRRRA